MKKIAGACLLLSIGTAVTLARNQDSANAGPFAGRWVVRADDGDGTFRETVFALDQRGSALTGRVINPTNEQPIVDGTVMGDDVRIDR
jgi:hypothetical protein